MITHGLALLHNNITKIESTAFNMTDNGFN